MDSGHCDSSSCGEEQEYDSRAAAAYSFSSFVNHPIPSQPPPFDPYSNFLQLQNSSPNVFWPRNADLSSDPCPNNNMINFPFTLPPQPPTVVASGNNLTDAPPASAAESGTQNRNPAARNTKKRSRASKAWAYNCSYYGPLKFQGYGAGIHRHPCAAFHLIFTIPKKQIWSLRYILKHETKTPGHLSATVSPPTICTRSSTAVSAAAISYLHCFHFIFKYYQQCSLDFNSSDELPFTSNSKFKSSQLDYKPQQHHFIPFLDGFPWRQGTGKHQHEEFRRYDGIMDLFFRVEMIVA